MADEFEFSIKLRLPREIKRDDIIEVKAKIKHPSSTGLQLVQTADNRYDRFIRSQPAVYVRMVEVFYGDETISTFHMNASSSDNPLLAFKLKATQETTIRVVVTNHKKDTVTASETISFTNP